MFESYKYNIDLHMKPRFDIGDRLYIVQHSIVHQSTISFAEPCPVCDDTKSITVRGFTLPCSYCKGYYPTENKSATRITLTNWEAIEYIVNKITIEGPDKKSHYDEKTDKAIETNPFVREISAFTRFGNGYNNVETKRIDSLHYTNDEEAERAFDNYKNGKYELPTLCFRSKANANRFVKQLKKVDMQRLESFNQEHHCNHNYPW